MIEVLYRNHRGERAVRRISPMRVYFGDSSHHQGRQWLMLVWDFDKNAYRTYALRDCDFVHASDGADSRLWLVWFAYYSEQANVGIVEADSAEAACRSFWDQHGGEHWPPSSGVHALPVVSGQAIEINAEH